jgi:elongation factor Ts
MSEISATAVKTLRDRTNQPMMDCKKALVEAGGDMDKAVEILRTRGKNVVVKVAGRETGEGRVTAQVEPGKVGVLVEVRCETAPVAKTEQFIQMCNELAQFIAKNPVANVDELMNQPWPGEHGRTVKDRIEDRVALIREPMKVARFARLEGQTGAYAHHDGSVGVLLQVEGGNADPQVLRDICMHITAFNPVAATRDEVPADVLARERDIAIGQVREDPKMAGKPDKIIEGAAQGKLSKWLAQNVLLDQPFVKDETKTVGQLLKDAGVKFKKFIRFKIGEVV